jgi:signal transduction histidine kinase
VVRVAARCEDGRIVIEIGDDGRGFTLPADGGRGLANMRGRAAALGGELLLRSSPGQGTTVTLVLRADAWAGPQPDAIS